MKPVSVWVMGLACYATLFAIFLGAANLVEASLPQSTVSDRKAPVMICNAAASIIRGVGAGWRRQ